MFSNEKISKDFTIQTHVKLVTLGNPFHLMSTVNTFGEGPLDKATCKIW